MANINPVFTREGDFKIVVLWETLTESDTAIAIKPRGQAGSLATFQVQGTPGGATIVLEGSNDGGTTWATVKDTAGAAVSFANTAGTAEVSTAFEQLRPGHSGGTSQDVDCRLVLSGEVN